MREFFLKLFLFYGIFFSTFLFAQKDLPNPPANLQTIPAGSFIVPMDSVHQNIVPAGQAPFNLKAYGLVNSFLQNHFPVQWVIKSGKNLNDIDFSAQAERVSPSYLSPSINDFSGSVFIIPDTTLCNLSTLGIIQAFGNNVAVYRLTQSVVTDVRYTITHKPKIAVFTNGENQVIHSKILDEAGIPDYDLMDAADINNLYNCYTFASEPHWNFTGANLAVVTGVKNFVLYGGNFLAECEAVETYENWGFIHSTQGIVVTNANITHSYHNADLAYMQFHGTVFENKGGSIQNWALAPGSSWLGYYYPAITDNNLDTIMASGAHLIAPNAVGGNSFYLGHHDYMKVGGSDFDLSDLKKVNALRMYLNAVFIPAIDNNVWANAGSDQSITCSGSVTLGCTPAVSAGATFSWSPATGLSCTNCENPVASPTVTTSYILTTAGGNGCIDADTVQVFVSSIVTATITSTPTCATSNGGSATANLSGGISPYTYQWSNGQTTQTATGLVAGTYSVTVTSANGCSAIATQTVAVYPLPVSNLSGTSVCFNNPTTFTDLSTGNNTISSWEWNLGDGNTSTLQNPVHTYGNSGTYTVSLIVTNDYGCKDTNTTTVIVNPIPFVNFSSPPVCFGNQTCFTDMSTIAAPGTITSWNWTFGDPNSGAQNSSTLSAPCHTFTSSGSFTVALTVTSDQGCLGMAYGTAAFNPPPIAAFTNSGICLNSSTSFTNSSTSSGSDPINVWEWNFGDGSISNVPTNPTHIYTTAGNYTVTLIVTTQGGCKDTIDQPVIVHMPPVANFSGGAAGCKMPVCVPQFSDLSTSAEGVINSWLWSFPGGTPSSSTAQNPQNICYNTPGTYGASLIVTTTDGCKDTVAVTPLVNVYTSPTADFCVTPSIAPTTDPVFNFCDQWSSDVVQWVWSFGDNDSDNVSTDPVHSYSATATNNDFYAYNICIRVQNQYGCWDTTCRLVELLPEFTFYIPNTFTPNGDNDNELFFGKSRGVKEYNIWVFDRWGNLLWDCHHEGKNTDWDSPGQDGLSSFCKWDGKVVKGGRDMSGGSRLLAQEDVYVWKVLLTDIFDKKHNYIGHVSIVK